MSIIFLSAIMVAFLRLLLVVPVANAAVSISNDVSVKVDKDKYKFGWFTCHVSGLSKHNSSVHSFNTTINEDINGHSYSQGEVYTKKRNNIKIVASSQLQLLNNSNINDLTDIPSLYGTVFSNISSNKDSINVTLKWNEEQFLGPKFYKRINFGHIGDETDNGYTKLDIGNTSWIPAGPYCCIVINNDKNKVLGASQSFTVTGPPDPVIIKVLTTSVLPGQTLKADVYNPNYTMFENFVGDYIRIYKVPYDVSNNLTELNTDSGTAKFVGPAYFEYLQYPVNRWNYSSIVVNVVWKQTGKYQIVMLSDYGQLFRGISNVFEIGAITRAKNTTVTIDTNSTFPGENYNVTIYKPDPPYGSQIAIAYMKAKDKVVDYINGPKGWVSVSRGGTWNSTTTNLTINTYFNEWRYGLYKVVVLAGDVVIGVSKPLLIKRPNIQVPLMKRTYSQWETMPSIIKPYTNFRSDSHFSFEVVSKSQPDSYYSNGGFTETWGGPDRYGYVVDVWQNSTLVTFAPGLYNIRLVVHKVRWYDNFQYYKLDYVTSIPNTTFRVIQNVGQIMIANNQTKFKYGNTLKYSFTTTNKVPLHGPISIYSTGKSWAAPIGTLQQQLDSNRNNTTINMNTLYGTLLVDTYTFGCPSGQSPYNVKIYTSESTGDIENVYSSIISIDPASTPKDQC